MKPGDRYLKIVEWSVEWIAIHKADGVPLPEPTSGREYSGKFVVRVGTNLHRQLAVEALREGVSLNAHCSRVLREGRTAYGKGK